MIKHREYLEDAINRFPFLINFIEDGFQLSFSSYKINDFFGKKIVEKYEPLSKELIERLIFEYREKHPEDFI